MCALTRAKESMIWELADLASPKLLTLKAHILKPQQLSGPDRIDMERSRSLRSVVILRLNSERLKDVWV